MEQRAQGRSKGFRHKVRNSGEWELESGDGNSNSGVGTGNLTMQGTQKRSRKLTEMTQRNSGEEQRNGGIGAGNSGSWVWGSYPDPQHL